MKEILEQVPLLLRNRYVVTSVVFFVWMLLIDQNDLITQIKLHRQLNKLEEEKAYYENQISNIRKQWESLMIDDSELERLAREKYLMKKDSEEVFVLVAQESADRK